MPGVAEDLGGRSGEVPVEGERARGICQCESASSPPQEAPASLLAADHAAGRLGGDLAVGQFLLEGGHSSRGDLSVSKVEFLKLRHRFKMHQVSIRDVGPKESKFP